MEPTRFVQIGTYLEPSFAHIVIRIDTKQVTNEHWTAAMDAIKNVTSKLGSCMKCAAAAKSLRDQADKWGQKAKQKLAAIDTILGTERQKRQFVEGAVVVGAVGWMAYNTYEIEMIKVQMRNENALIRAVQQEVGHFESLRKSVVKMEEMINQSNIETALHFIKLEAEAAFRDSLQHLDSMEHSLIELFQGKLVPGLVQESRLKIALNELAQQAAKYNLKLQNSALLAVYQSEVSYQIGKGQVEIALHIPLVGRNEQEWVLFRHVPSPTLVGGLRVSISDPLFDYIAVSTTTDEHIPLHAGKLAECHRTKNKEYFCDQGSVIFRRFAETCIGSVYSKQEESVAKRCIVVKSNVTEKAESLGVGKFRTIGAGRISLKCLNGTNQYEFSGIREHNLAPGCEALTDEIRVENKVDIYSFVKANVSVNSSLNLTRILHLLEVAEAEKIRISKELEHLESQSAAKVDVPAAAVNDMLLWAVTCASLALSIAAWAVIVRAWWRRAKEREREGRAKFEGGISVKVETSGVDK